MPVKKEPESSEQTGDSLSYDGIPFNVFLDGNIGDQKTSQIIKELIFWENQNLLSAIKRGPVYPIILHVNSFGGDVYDTLSIIDTMKGLETPVVTYCSGKAMSGAALVFLAGKKGHRLLSRNGWIMIHEVSSLLSGPLSKIKHTGNHLGKLQRQLENQISQLSGIEIKKIRCLLKEDQYYNAKESIKNGLADRIVYKVPKIVEGISMCYFAEGQLNPTNLYKNTKKGKS